MKTKVVQKEIVCKQSEADKVCSLKIATVLVLLLMVRAQENGEESSRTKPNLIDMVSKQCIKFTDRQTDRHTDRQTNRQTDRKTVRQAAGWTDGNFSHSTGLCPITSQDLKENLFEKQIGKGKGTTDHFMPLGDWSLF